MPRLLYRIIPASAKRMAAENTAYTEKAPSNNTIFFNCLNRICGTRWKKATTWRQKGRQEIFIPFYKTNTHCFEEAGSHLLMLPENNQCDMQEKILPCRYP